MLAIASQQLNSTFERIVRDKNGVLVRVRFIVVEVNGTLQAQIVSAEALLKVNKEEILALPQIKDTNNLVINTVTPFIYKISPYFSLDFLMSQPTRAPAL